MGIKFRLTVMNFLQYAVWGSYLTSMGSYLVGAGLAAKIGLFYAMQGIVSLFMPAIIGILADRWIQAQRLLGMCHGLAALFMAGAGYYALTTGSDVQFGVLFTLYAMSVAFYMPTIALSNSVAYSVLESNNMDTVKVFPPIRVWGTVGFICAMLFCDMAGFQTTYMQFIQCAVLGLGLGVYAFTLPACPVTVADTIGAGDAHIGAVIALTAEGHSLQEAVGLANRVSAAVVASQGAEVTPETLLNIWPDAPLASK